MILCGYTRLRHIPADNSLADPQLLQPKKTRALQQLILLSGLRSRFLGVRYPGYWGSQTTRSDSTILHYSSAGSCPSGLLMTSSSRKFVLEPKNSRIFSPTDAVKLAITRIVARTDRCEAPEIGQRVPPLRPLNASPNSAKATTAALVNHSQGSDAAAPNLCLFSGYGQAEDRAQCLFFQPLVIHAEFVRQNPEIQPHTVLMRFCWFSWSVLE